MHRFRKHLFTGLLLLGVPMIDFPLSHRPVRSAPPEGNLTFMGTFTEWLYPDCKRFHGGEMSGNGPPRLRSVRCKAVMTTPDPFEKVVAFYAKKIEADEPAGPPDPKVEARSLGIQDDSVGRPVSVRIFSVHKTTATTVLVISRDEKEKETHIAWSYFQKLEDIK